MKKVKHLQKARVKYNQKKYSDALVSYFLVPSNLKTSKDKLCIAISLYKTFNFNIAKDSFMSLSMEQTNDSKVFNYLGLCYIQLAKKKYSIESINLAIKSFKKASEISYNKGIKENYFKAKKVKYLADKQERQTSVIKIISLASKYDISIDRFLGIKDFQKENDDLDHLICPITLVSL